MMRVGTQRRSKSSNSSPNTTYRHSPVHARVSPVTTSQFSTNQNLPNTSYNTKQTFRQSPSPVLADTHKYTQDFHRTVTEKCVTSSPKFGERSSPSYLQRTSSPQAQRTHSPTTRTQSPDYISSKRLNERRYETSSPSFNTNFANKMRISESHSPTFNEPDVGYTTSSRFDKKVIQNRTYALTGYDETDGVDTSPIIKVSGNDRSTARHDSWDAIEKTRNILSNRSLESVANLTEEQLDARKYRQRTEEHNMNYVNREQQVRQNYSQNYSQKYASFDEDFTEKTYGQNYRNSKTGGASAVKVQNIPDGILGQPVEFESKYRRSGNGVLVFGCLFLGGVKEFFHWSFLLVDGSGAGSGDLEILVEGGRVTSSVRSLGGQRFKAAFTPHQALPHRVDIRFNGATVPGK